MRGEATTVYFSARRRASKCLADYCTPRCWWNLNTYTPNACRRITRQITRVAFWTKWISWVLSSEILTPIMMDDDGWKYKWLREDDAKEKERGRERILSHSLALYLSLFSFFFLLFLNLSLVPLYTWSSWRWKCDIIWNGIINLHIRGWEKLASDRNTDSYPQSASIKVF